MAWASHPGSTGQGVNSRLHFLSPYLLPLTYLRGTTVVLHFFNFFRVETCLLVIYCPLDRRWISVLSDDPTCSHSHRPTHMNMRSLLLSAGLLSTCNALLLQPSAMHARASTPTMSAVINESIDKENPKVAFRTRSDPFAAPPPPPLCVPPRRPSSAPPLPLPCVSSSSASCRRCSFACWLRLASHLLGPAQH